MFVTALYSLCYLDIQLHIYGSLQVVLLYLKSLILREVSIYSGAPKQSCSALQNFSWRPWSCTNYVIETKKEQ